ncbi:GntR family transcriptional regulator [Labrenzia sp. DG1229]|uniref:GntR family transcriptional regulator n=1 Tax=Labrenzia sp. DG1229 TaxID=681847 RepID=UPI00048CCB21|nr:GntR family transcriptional regulator [Labrenzia sp. DG1229]
MMIQKRTFPARQLASMEQWAYDTIKDRILTLELRPGATITEAELAKSLDVSKTPLRAALMQLERDELVESAPYKGSWVRPVTLESIQHLFQLREAIEGFAVEAFALVKTPEQLSKLQNIERSRLEAVEQNQVDLAIVRDAEFHSYPVQALGNPHLDRLMINISDHRRRLRHLLADHLPAPSPYAITERHNALLAAFEKGEAEQVRAIVVDGIRALLGVAEEAAAKGALEVSTDR